MRMMGAASVAYHKESIIERGDDYPGQALGYYGSRGETPLLWGGSGTGRLGVSGAVDDQEYEAIFGPGGARHPGSGVRLASTRRPGMELVIAAHKSVAELGVIGLVEDMHQIMDAERDATLGYLDEVTAAGGGRRGRSATATATAGLIYSHTRHATSRSGDPAPHDHVLLANLVRMLDEQGGWKAADTTLWREHLHAATMVGRVAAARRTVELGYAIEADEGPSGRLRHWRIQGVPDEVIRVHSKRAAEIQEEVDRRGATSYQARGVAARATRGRKRHEPIDELLPHWQQELAEVGWPVERLSEAVREAGLRMTVASVDVRQVLAEVLDEEGLLAREKVFARKEVIVEVAPHLFGQDPAVLHRIVGRAIADPETVPLVRVAGAREPVYSLASVLARETAIAASVERLVEHADRPTVDPAAALAATEGWLGGQLSTAQREAVDAICGSGRGAEIVVGVAGSGKTTMLNVVGTAFESAGCQVLGTATSGQAARNLGTEADIDNSRTIASLMWHLEHDRLRLDNRTVVILDEAGMTDDPDMLRLAIRIDEASAKLIVVGDHRQLGPVGPGGAMGALVQRHP
jgi:conjugative relaxase-like TrwC/TraI family protein